MKRSLNVHLSRRALIAAAGLVSVAASFAHADEDWRKLRDVQPSIVGPIVTGAAAQALVAEPGDVRPAGDPGTFNASNIQLLAWIPLNNLPGGGTSGNDCWGYTSPSGREYALMGTRTGLVVVEVTNPTAPVILGHIAGPNSLWHDVDVVGQYAYLASEGGQGIRVVDLRNVDSGQISLARTVLTGGHTTTHTLIANPDSGYLYALGANISNGGMVIFDTRPDPTNPRIVGSWNTRYVHEAHIVSYTTGPYAGKEIAFLFTGGPFNGNNVSGLDIVDVTNKAALVTLSSVRYPGIRFSHQGWTTEDRRYLYINDELDEQNGTVTTASTIIYNIENLASPTYIGKYTNNNPSVDHNLYVKGNLIFASNYRSGLRVFDISSRTAPTEVAFFDTFAADDAAQFNGNWGNYPYFASGTIVISDLERGLFLLRLQLERIDFAFPTGTPTQLSPTAPTAITVDVTANQTTLDPATVRLNWTVNGGSPQSVAMTAQGSGRFAANIPATACFSRVNYWISASDTQNRAFTSPANAPANTYIGSVFTGVTTISTDELEVADPNWTVQNDASVTAGAWVRVDPIGTLNAGVPAQPENDNTPAPGVNAFVTGQGAPGGTVGAADLDGGPTRLTSPVFNLAAQPEARISYARWFYTSTGEDRLTVEVSNNNGTSWTTVESVGNANAWTTQSFRVADFVTPTAQVRVRFSASDNPNNSVVEAAIDSVIISTPVCVACVADFDNSGTVDVNDFFAYLDAFASNNPRADVDGTPGVNINDFFTYLTLYSTGCQ